MSTTLARRALVYAVLRTAHLERLASTDDISVLYNRSRYDFDADLARLLRPRRVTGPAALWHFTTRPYRYVEINEPLAFDSVRFAALAVLGIRMGDAWRRRRTVVTTYAIDNLDPHLRPAPAGLRSRLARRLDRRLATLLWRQLDRAVFGTPAARQTYTRHLGPPGPRTTTHDILALPAPCHCLDEADTPRKPEHLVFVGDLSRRKGFDIVLAAWPRVLELSPTAALTIIGTGAMRSEAEAATHRWSEVTFHHDPPRDLIHRTLATATVLVLPSRTSDRWREQVGLPIVEALAHGLTVVTTDATGLAEWLHDHGHVVAKEPVDPECIAGHLAALLHQPLPTSAVLTSLPRVDGREAAGSWMSGSPDQRARTP